MGYGRRGMMKGPIRPGEPGDGLRDAALLGAGLAVIGGMLWWGRNRSKAHRREAPGRPGDVPHWNFSSKEGVGTALGPGGRAESRVWFTLRRGAFTEVFYPRADRPAVRGLGLIVTDGHGLCSDERHDADHEIRMVEEGVPAFELVNTCRLGRYRIEKTILAHPRRDVVLQFTRFVPLVGRLEDFRLFTLLDPQVADQGEHNTAWIGDHKGMPMLFAERAGNALALACSVPWADATAGFIGRSDGRRDLRRHGRLIRTYERAEDGNVALIGEVGLAASGGRFVQALGFGASPSEAGHQARAALLDDLEAVREEYGEPAKQGGNLKFWYRPEAERDHDPAGIVSPDALAYVRFGLRAADDPRILDTVKVIDAINKVDLPQGPCWHRYNHDGYGEQRDGSPFDNHLGIGRAWPLLSGERGHYELAAGRPDEAARMLRAMAGFANEGGMIPEQVWDSQAIPAKELQPGRPTGSAMPLAWAHAEYLKLRRSLADGHAFDTPPQTVQRYVVEKVQSPFVIWRPDHRRRVIPAGKTLRVEVAEPAVVRWGLDGGPAGGELPTRETGLGVHVADLPTSSLPFGASIRLAFSRAGGGHLTGKEDGRSIGAAVVVIERLSGIGNG